MKFDLTIKDILFESFFLEVYSDNDEFIFEMPINKEEMKQFKSQINKKLNKINEVLGE